jgi:hypothetical protein
VTSVLANNSFATPLVSERAPDIRSDLVAWPFQISIVVTFLTSFVALPGPPIFRILPTALFLLIGILRTPPHILGLVRIDPFLILLIIWSIASVEWSVDRGQTLQQVFREFSRVLSIVVATSVLGYDRTRSSF